MATTVNGKDILHTIANNITGVTLSPGAASSGGATSKGMELNAYAKAYKIITENEAYIDTKGGSDTAVGDVIEEIFFSHQIATASPYTTGSGGSYGGTVAVTAGVNAANGFNALFMANAIDQFRQVDGQTATTINDVGTVIDSYPFRLIQAQGSSAMTITLQNSAGATPTATASVHLPFRIKSGTAAASLLLGRTEYGSAVAATTLTLDSGATLGMTNSIEATLYIYAINSAGTINLGIINGQRLDESVLHTSTALDGTADTASTLYSDSAITSCAVRLLGRMRHTMNAVGTYDEDPVELGILGVGSGSSGGAGELAAGEKIFWADTNQFIQGDTTSITIESDDTFTVQSDTLASINSTTKAEIVAPTSNVVATTAANVNSPIIYMTGNVAITHASDSHLAIGKNTWASGYQIDLQDNAPIFRMKSSDSADDNEAKRSRFVMEGDGGEEMFKIDTKHLGTGNDAASQVIFSNRSGTATSAFMTANSLHGVTFGANVAISGSLTVSGTTTQIDSTVVTIDDPIFTLGGDTAPGSDDNKDRGIFFRWFGQDASTSYGGDGTEVAAAKTGFFGWDDSTEEFVLARTGSISSEVFTPTAATGYGHLHTGKQIKIGNAQAEDTKIIFDGNAQDYYIALDDSADDLLIGLGSTIGTNPAISIDENLQVTLGGDGIVTDDFTLKSDAAVLGFGNDTDVTLTHVADAAVMLNTTMALRWRDATLGINSSADGQLDIYADTELEITSPIVDIDASTSVNVSNDLKLDSDAAVLGFGADNDVTLTHVADAAVMLNAAMALRWRDATLGINSSTDGQLDIYADVELEITAPTIDIDASTAVLISNDLKLNSDAAVLGFGVDNDVTLTHVADNALMLNAAMQLRFRDAAILIGSSADGQLDIDADTEVEITTTTVDLNGILDVSGASTLTGVVTVGAGIIADIQDGAYLGSSSKQFSDLFLADEAQVLFGDDGEVTLTHVHNTGLLLSDDSGVGTTQLQFGDAGTYINQSADGALDLVSDGSINATVGAAGLVLKGTTPKLTVGDAGAEDTMIVFDGNAADFRLGLDDSSDKLEIGAGSAHGTTAGLIMDSLGNIEKLGVDTQGSGQDGYVLTWDNDNTKWAPAAASGGGSYGGTAATVALAIGQAPAVADTNTGFFSPAADRLAISAGGTQRLEANTTGVHVTTLTETSYRELKENITPMVGSLDKIMALQGINFDWIGGENKQIGLLADDVAKVVPELVQFEKRGRKKKAVALQYSKMVALLIEGMKEQQQEINELKRLIPKT